MKPIIAFVAALFLLAGCSSAPTTNTPPGLLAAETWTAKIWWRIDENGNSMPFYGLGSSKEAAFDYARNECNPRYGSYCSNKPMREEYSVAEDCGRKWTACVTWGQPPGDPCAPEGCRRGLETDFHIKFGCSDHEFQCYRDKASQ